MKKFVLIPVSILSFLLGHAQEKQMKQVDSLQRLFFEDKGKAMPSVAPKTSN